MSKAKFAMAFHCCQPVDNFDWEVEKSYKLAYLPLLRTLENFPGIKASFHFSGSLLEWIERRHPICINEIKKLARRGQIELIGGGCYEPVMTLIPERDRKEQIRMNEEIMTRMFEASPRGVWMAEKVWEPDLADTLSSAGAEYTILDDYHLLQAGIAEEDIFKPCKVRGKEGDVTLFPSLTRLRYSMPFRSAEVTLDYMKNIVDKDSSGGKCFFFADDGEKFGAWPHTFFWVHKKGWLRDFFLLLQKNSDWLETVTYSEAMDTTEPSEVAEVPGSSYAEMMEWSGGNFRNFLTKYSEADRMHKRMIHVSDAVDKVRIEDSPAESGKSIEDAKKEVLKSQSSCAYWHGTFGGVYFPHLRSGVYSHLIKAQNIVDAVGKEAFGAVKAVERDAGDGKRETVIRNKFIDLFVRSSGGGTVEELDYKPLSMNLTNTMSRVKEKYHKKLNKKYYPRIKEARNAMLRGDFADVHDVLGVGERGLGKAFFYDNYRRTSFLTHIFTGKDSWKTFHKGTAGHDRFLKGTYRSLVRDNGECIEQVLSRRDKIFLEDKESLDLEVIKNIRIGTASSIDFHQEILQHSGKPVSLRHAMEFNFSLYDKTFGAKPKLMKTDRFALADEYSGVRLDFFLNREFSVFMYPVYTVNETEMGLKKTYQGISVLIGDECRPAKSSSMRDMLATVRIG